ncbi:MAG: methyltransferase domain-containing protein [Candidatus Eisenbacteria bacterium]|nr:methyltransferase domain-containing protein [Candidatus Latescibacterota bacterium]MBD3302295.1 methyltransferase domain-containing protein [Candidatus Eisenbacteria bacterium]
MRASTPDHWDRYWRDRTETIEDVYSNEDRILRQLDDLPLAGRRVLEVGAGSGRDSLELARRGARIFVLDYVESSFDVIRRLAMEEGIEVRCVCADATAMPFRDDRFALVFHQGLLEHFRDPEPLLRENHRVVEPGGHCLVDVPQRYHVYTLAKHMMIALNRWFAGWETEFAPGRLERLMRRAGFRIVRTDGDWFRPGFFYRGFRYALQKAKIARLPLYPRIPRWLDAGPAWIRRRLRGTRLGLHTYAMIGTLGRKEPGR